MPFETLVCFKRSGAQAFKISTKNKKGNWHTRSKNFKAYHSRQMMAILR